MISRAKQPDFVCIGPEKTGTGWLYKALSAHPGAWMPPIKELRFLNEGNHVPDHTLKNLILSSHWHYRALRRQLLFSIPRIVLPAKVTGNRRGIGQFRWMLNYCLRSHSFDWYSDLFPRIPKVVCGDISPLYYGIPESRIAELSRYKDNLKIIVFVRNPIERVWSKARMNLCAHKGRKFDDVPASEVIAFVDAVYEGWRPYADTIESWKRYFAEVFVGFFDALDEDPARFFRDICSFLGLSIDVVFASVGERVNVGVDDRLPARLRNYLRSQYHSEIKMLAESSNYGYPRLWLEREYS